jgi:hypothetical protein
MRYPVDYIVVTQPFKNHYGVDLGWSSKILGKNQPIYAVDDGIVIYNRHQTSGGYVIHIKHDNGFVSEYGHLKKDSQRVHEGDKVKKGQHIADMGGTGRVTGNHLHFGLYKGSKINYGDRSKFVNPLLYLCAYDNQTINSGTLKKYKIYRTKKVTSKDGLNIRTGPSTKYKIVRTARYNEELESFGLKNKWNIVDNIRGYYCSNNYLRSD